MLCITIVFCLLIFLSYMQELLQLNIKNSFLIITLKMVLLHGSIKLRSSLYGKYY